ncbi:MAG TPA: BTAD domain-containing putative transcriptional regulator [Actinomycetes bacterium]|nr:BTAD domain-containing putative transcriptional regulator [Actinomycetes bacterium]
MAVSPAFGVAAAGGSTLFAAPPSYLLTEELAAALERRGEPVLWLRIGPEDQDPGTLLLSLVEAMQRHEPSFGEATIPLMRRRPGPVTGWPPLFDQLARELAEALGPHGSIVVEDVGRLDGLRPTLRLLGTRLLSALPDEVACILTSHRSLPGSALPAGTTQRGAADLRIDTDLAAELITHSLPAASNAFVRQAAALCEGQPVTLLALGCAVRDFGADVVDQVVRDLSRTEELLRFLARAWLALDGIDQQRALGLALHLGYTHPSLAVAVAGSGVPTPSRPWLQALTGGWSRVRGAWLAPLRTMLRPDALPDRDTLHRAAAQLVRHGAEELGIELYLELDDAACATPMISEAAGRLLDEGRWDTLGGWVGRLPESALQEQPRLLYVQAEIAAGEGEIQAARRDFRAAAERFTAQGDHDGACQSILAESALVADLRDLEHANRRTLAVGALADATGLAWYQLWSSWQLGILAVLAGEVDQAQAYFDRAKGVATRLGDHIASALTTRAEQVTGHLLALHRERELHRRAYQALERTTQEAVGNLRRVLQIPPHELEALAGSYGWMRTPMVLKLPPSRNDTPGPGAGGNFWSRAQRVLGLRAGHPPGGLAHALSPSAEEMEVSRVGIGTGPWSPEGTPARLSEMPCDPITPSLPAGDATLTVHLLGHLRVSLNDVPVRQWPSGRARAVLKYLVTHRDPWPTRHVLMEVFWPNATPKSARNNLNVAVHGLRRALRALADVPVVILQDAAYRLHPDLRLWLDVDEFEHSADLGRRLEAAGELEAASVAYEMAIGLYDGDFLADDPYEQWAVLDQEHLRLAYLDTLDRLSNLYFGRGRYTSCAALCRRIIERDACREDAHRRLMRCYSRQGQPHLALRQYEVCARLLQAELDVEPDPATVELKRRIHGRDPV